MNRNARAEKMQKMAWDTSKGCPQHIKDNMSAGELTYYTDYCKLLDAYNTSLSKQCNMDLTKDVTPPKELYISVRVLVDQGRVLLEGKNYNLQKDTIILMKRSEADALIKRGMVSEAS